MDAYDRMNHLEYRLAKTAKSGMDHAVTLSAEDAQMIADRFDAERRLRAAINLYGILVGSWLNRPDLTDIGPALGRLRWEFDRVLEGGSVSFDRWMEDPNGRFVNDLAGRKPGPVVVTLTGDDDYNETGHGAGGGQ